MSSAFANETDYHTADLELIEVWKEKAPEVELLVGVYQGIDKTMHSVGIHSEEHKFALLETLPIIFNTAFDLLDENTTLIVHGDHGSSEHQHWDQS